MDLIWLALVLAALGIVAVFVFTLVFRNVPRPPRLSEKTFLTNTADGDISEPLALEQFQGDAETIEVDVSFSLVIPCYNETARLGIMLEEAVPVLNRLYKGAYEIVVVDDGSTDGSPEFAVDWAAQHDLVPGTMRVVRLEENRGKGGAVTHGMKAARGNLVLFADADGASRFEDLTKLVAAIGGKTTALAIGSRAHMVKTDAVVKRTWIRNMLMYGLHTLVYVFGIRSVGDTQCGFKLFTRQAVREIFPHMHTERWIFDVEVLLIALKHNIPIHEVAISWHEVDGSKIELARDSIKMAIDLVVIRFAYIFGLYRC